MKDIEIILKSVSEILKSLSKGSAILSDKINKLGRSLDEMPAEATTRPRKASTMRAVAKKERKVTAADKIFFLIENAKDGANMEFLMQKSGFDRKKVQNIIFKLKKLKKIKVKSRGVYISI